MQLVAYGAQDVYLTGTPQITFFKLMYRRHTNFAIESIEQTFNGTPGFGKKASATISRNGDLISGIFLQVTLPEAGKDPTGAAQSSLGLIPNSGDHSYQYVNSVMHRFLESCEIEIGGQRIDKHYSHFYEVCDELTTAEEKRIRYGNMVGKLYDDDGKPLDGLKVKKVGTTYSLDNIYSKLDSSMGGSSEVTYYMPLRFWFNNNPGLALPLIALQYHEVKLQMSFAPKEKLIKNNWIDVEDGKPKFGEVKADGTLGFYEFGTKTEEEPKVSLWVDYVYLDTDERRRFAQASHEYLIEQLQFTGSESYTLGSNTLDTKVRLNFNHPTKELIWFVHGEDDDFNFGESVKKLTADDYDDDYGVLDDSHTNQFSVGHDYVQSAKLLLNGHERFTQRPGSYFRLVVPYQCHTRIPSRHIYCYSFSLKPEEHQPSGSCNFSRIDNASLHLTLSKSTKYTEGTYDNTTTFDNGEQTASVHPNYNSDKAADEMVKLTVYAISYNILRIVSGMGGLAYSN